MPILREYAKRHSLSRLGVSAMSVRTRFAMLLVVATIGCISMAGEARSEWESQGSPPGVTLDSRPTCISWGPNRIDCFVLGSDHAMHQKAWDGQNWSGWRNLGRPPDDVTLLYRATCVSWGPNRIDCFVLGGDNSMHQIAWDGQNWSGWRNLGRPDRLLHTPPTCVSWGPNRIDCFGPDSLNSAMHQKAWDGQNWSGWRNLDGPPGVTFFQPTCVSWGPNRSIASL
jgi:hypothetical protein